eukprot:14831338-Heterocapsa_arctica.AAC.1
MSLAAFPAALAVSPLRSGFRLMDGLRAASCSMGQGQAPRALVNLAAILCASPVLVDLRALALLEEFALYGALAVAREGAVRVE